MPSIFGINDSDCNERAFAQGCPRIAIENDPRGGGKSLSLPNRVKAASDGGPRQRGPIGTFVVWRCVRAECRLTQQPINSERELPESTLTGGSAVR